MLIFPLDTTHGSYRVLCSVGTGVLGPSNHGQTDSWTHMYPTPCFVTGISFPEGCPNSYPDNVRTLHSCRNDVTLQNRSVLSPVTENEGLDFQFTSGATWFVLSTLPRGLWSQPSPPLQFMRVLEIYRFPVSTVFDLPLNRDSLDSGLNGRRTGFHTRRDLSRSRE